MHFKSLLICGSPSLAFLSFQDSGFKKNNGRGGGGRGGGGFGGRGGGGRGGGRGGGFGNKSFDSSAPKPNKKITFDN